MQTNLSVQIAQYLDKLPPTLQEEVLAFIEFLISRQQRGKKERKPAPPKRELTLIGSGNSNGTINNIQSLRDFAHD